jgi:hypothetical protein
MDVSAVIRGGFLFGMSSSSSQVCRHYVDDEQNGGSIGFGRDLDGDDLKLAASVIGSQVCQAALPWAVVTALAAFWPSRTGRILYACDGVWRPD